MSFRLPSLHALRAFEAAARLGGFNKAAKELGVSPTAISHHIRGLEAALGVALFTRQTRKVRLTEAGERLAKVCSAAFENLANAVAELLPAKGRRSVTIALGPFLASRWLAPRLPRFWEAFPGIDLRLVHTPDRAAPETVDADIFLAWGTGDWPGVISCPLLRVAATPVASPGLIEQLGRPERLACVTRFPLIHQRDRSAWSEWLATAGVADTGILGGVVIEDANVVLRSVLDGQGIALGWLPLIDDEIASGRLVRLFDACLPGPRAYHLIRSPASRPDKIVGDVADWLIREAELVAADVV